MYAKESEMFSLIIWGTFASLILFCYATQIVVGSRQEQNVEAAVSHCILSKAKAQPSSVLQ
jgi:hypothetical protein